MAVAPSGALTPAYIDNSFTRLFASLRGAGWVGGDLTSSLRLPDGRSAWFVGDTITASWSDGMRWAHNSMVLTGGGVPEVIPDVLPNLSDGSFFWPGAARAEGSHIWVLAQRLVSTGSGLWDFRFSGTWLARLDVDTWHLDSDRPVVGGCSAINWSDGLFDDGLYTYIYGLETRGAETWLHVARIPKGRLDSPWRFYTGLGWSASARSSARVLNGVSSVSMLNLGARGLRLISQAPTFGRTVYSWRAETPFGPFERMRAIYRIPSTGARTFTYDTLAHSQYADGRTMLFSFDVNSFDVLTPATASLYRPRFFRLPISAL